MPAFVGSMLVNALSLPLKAAVGSVATDAAKSATQGVVDFASATFGKKKAEVLDKLSETGNASSFNKLSPDVDLVKSNGSVDAVLASTGDVLGSVGNYQQNGVPASLGGKVNEDRTSDFKVMITANPGIYNGDFIIFDIMPSISESRSTTYDSTQIIHHPGEILKYKSSGARSWSIKATFMSRSPEEASRNLNYINMIRTWVMPFYGVGTEQTVERRYLGAPPPILQLSGFGEYVISPVKCILESYDCTWPNDIDYVPTLDLTPFPVLIDVSLNLKESFSPAEYSSFDIVSYRNGMIENAFRQRLYVKTQSNKSGQVTSPSNLSTSEAPQTR